MPVTSAVPESFGLPERLIAWAEQLMLGLGYPGLALLIVVEQLVPPIPSTLILPTAGFLVSRGVWSLPGMIAAATLGSLLSALLLYGLGRWLDQALLGRLANCYSRWAASALLASTRCWPPSIATDPPWCSPAASSAPSAA